MKQYKSEALRTKFEKLLEAINVYGGEGKTYVVNKIDEDRNWTMNKIGELDQVGKTDDWDMIKGRFDGEDFRHANEVWKIVKVHPKFRK